MADGHGGDVSGKAKVTFFLSPAMLKEGSLSGLLPAKLSALTVTGPYAAILIERDFGRGSLCSRMNHCHSLSVRDPQDLVRAPLRGSGGRRLTL